MNSTPFTVITFIAISIFMTTACAAQGSSIEKPSNLEFGNSMAQIKQLLESQCDSIIERHNEPIQLPTATKSQSQLDVYGILYAGKKRNAELIFADDLLDLVWIFIKAEEEEFFLEQFQKKYGPPTHSLQEATFFLKDGTAVRNNPHEVLFISERLKEPYKQWLNAQVDE